MNPAPLNLPLRLDPQFGQHYLDELDREESALQATLDSVRELRTALLAADQQATAAALQRQERAAQDNAEVGRLRAQLRQSAAVLLRGAPEEVTLSRLAAALPEPLGDQVRARRERLRRLAADVNRLNESNAVLIHYSLDFLQRFFRDLTGRSSPQRYDPSGRCRPAVCGSLLEMKG